MEQVEDDLRLPNNKSMHISSAKDKNPIYAEMCYYGVIVEIWLLDYNMFKIPLFKCDWVDNNKGVKVDDLGFKLVELNRVGHKSDPFILASQANQVFYVEDQLDPKWFVVLASPTRAYIEVGCDDEVVDVCDEHQPSSSVPPSFESVDMIEESQSSYMRPDCEGIWIQHD